MSDTKIEGTVPESRTKPVAPKEQTKSQKLSRKLTVDAGTSVDDVLVWDAEGVDLLFEQKEGFIQLDKAVVSRLSPTNRTRYTMAREFHDTWRGDEHAAFVEKFKVDRQMVGSATDKLSFEEPAGMHLHWTRPDRIEKLRSAGYKILSDDEAKTFLGPTGGHHEVGRLGSTESVLMGIPEELYKRSMAEKTRRNNELAGSYKTAALAAMRQAGGDPFESGDSASGRDRHDWAEIPNE